MGGCSQSKSPASARSRHISDLEQEAEKRAKLLSLVPNSTYASLPLNREPKNDGLSRDDVWVHLGCPIAGKASQCSIAWLRERGAKLLSERPPSIDEVARMSLIDRVPARSGHEGYKQLRLSENACTNDHYITLLEQEAEEEPMSPDKLGSALIAYHQSLPYVLLAWRPTKSGNDVDRHHALNVLFGNPLIDRTGTLNNALNLKILYPMPALDCSFTMSLEQVIESRCKELLNTHQRLHLLWSGGIDTTTMIVGFLKFAKAEDWEDRLSVHYCASSKEEHPRFFERYIRSLPQHEEIKGHLRDFVDRSRIVVTGDPADMLFGCVAMQDAFKKTLRKYSAYGVGSVHEPEEVANPLYLALEHPWRSVVPEMLRALGVLHPGQRNENDWIHWISQQVAKAPIPVETVYDFYWWIGYSMKFQTDLLHLFFNQSEVTQEGIQSVEHFFLSAAWEQWCLHNHSSKMPDKLVWASHKQPLKQWIFEFDGDLDYYQNKTKVRSTHLTFGYQLGIDDAYNIIHFGRTSASLLKMQEKYGSSLQRFVTCDTISQSSGHGVG